MASVKHDTAQGHLSRHELFSRVVPPRLDHVVLDLNGQALPIFESNDLYHLGNPTSLWSSRTRAEIKSALVVWLTLQMSRAPSQLSGASAPFAG
jgi:hypothetical protein